MHSVAQRLAPTYCDKAVFEQSWWMVSAGRRSRRHIKSANHLVEKTMSDISLQRKIGLQIRQICLRLKTFEALSLQLFMVAKSHKHWRHSNVVFRNLGDQLLWQLCKISSVRCLADWRQSSETKETLFHTNTCELSGSNVVCRRVIVQIWVLQHYWVL